ADPMNRDPAFARSRLRHRWLPALREENPAVDRALCQLAESAAQQREVLDFAARAVLDQARLEPPEFGQVVGPAWLSTAVLAGAPEAVLRRALALAAEAVGGRPLEARHQRVLAALVRARSAGTRALDLPGLRALREYDRLALGPPPQAGTPHSASGEPDGADALAARVEVVGPEPPYAVRTWRPGDRMRPARLRGRSRKLSDLFTDARVPRRLRGRALIVERVRDRVIEWAEHIGPAHGSTVRVALTGRDPVTSNTVSELEDRTET
ncbi:MAG: tRNA lysidine(34) synthetase TilS, partial [Myxococcota bacterium]